MISLLTFKAYFSEPYKRTVSNWSSEEFWRVELNKVEMKKVGSARGNEQLFQ